MVQFTTGLAGRADRKPDRTLKTGPKENRNLGGMPGHRDLDPKTVKAARVPRVGKRPSKGW